MPTAASKRPEPRLGLNAPLRRKVLDATPGVFTISLRVCGEVISWREPERGSALPGPIIERLDYVLGKGKYTITRLKDA